MEEKVNGNVIQEKVVVENKPPVVEVVKPVEEKKREGFSKAIAIVLFVIILLMAGFMVWHFLTANHGEKECAGAVDEDVVVIDEINDNEESGDKYVSLMLDPKNALNGPSYNGDGYTLTLSDGLFDNAIVAHVTNIPEAYACGDEKVASQSVAYLDVNWDTVKAMYALDGLNKSGIENNLVVGNIDASRITDVAVSGFGQAVGYEAVLFLMDDGTVEYIPLMKALRDGAIRSYGKLDGVEGIVKFYKNNAGVWSCYGIRDVYAQRADGKYYSIGLLMDDLT